MARFIPGKLYEITYVRTDYIYDFSTDLNSEKNNRYVPIKVKDIIMFLEEDSTHEHCSFLRDKEKVYISQHLLDDEKIKAEEIQCI